MQIESLNFLDRFWGRLWNLGGNVAFGQIDQRGNAMSLGTILLIIVVLLLVGALPTWPHSAGWGYYPSGGLGLVLVILLVLLLLGRI